MAPDAPRPQSSPVHSSKLLHSPPEVEPLRGAEVHPDFAIEPATSLERSFRHSGWSATRQKVFESLRRCGCRGGTLQAFAECGSGCWVQHSASRGAFRTSSNCCKSRWCVPCGVARAARLRHSVQAELKEWERVRFVTLTLRHSNTPLADQIDRLQRSFRELRRRPEWASAVDGAAAFLEIKISSRDGLWHPHLHIITVGRWLDRRTLSAAWHAVTGDSSIVDIQLAKSPAGVASYVVKYVTKPVDGSVVSSPDRLDEAVVALKGRRLVNGSGCLRKISDDAVADGVDDWHTIGRLDDLINDARRGDTAALHVLASISTADRQHDVSNAPSGGVPPDKLIL